jgi:hypothetical protein
VDEGARDVAAFSLAKHFYRTGLPAEAARAALRAWNLRNRPPLPVATIAAKVAGVYRHGYRSYGCEDALVERFCGVECPLYQRRVGSGTNDA